MSSFVERPAPTVRLSWQALAVILLVGSLIANTLYSAPEPPGVREPWRWVTVIAALGLCAWNIRSGYLACKLNGILSMVGFLHAWSFFAFSFPAFEMTYRYDSLKLQYWTIETNDPVLPVAVLMLAAFQMLFFLALGREPQGEIREMVVGSRPNGTNRKLALVFLLLATPLIVARAFTIIDLGVQGIVETVVSRQAFTDRLTEEQSNIGWLLDTLFPYHVVPLLCLSVKYLVRHPSPLGGLLYAFVLILGGLGAGISGGRSELVFISFVVVLFMYFQGYRRPSQYKLPVLPILILGLAGFLAAQARNGGSNFLANLSGAGPAAYNYRAGDVTQALGLGRFDAFVMILDRFAGDVLLWGKSYVYAIPGGLNAALLPKIFLGDWLPTWRTSDQVLGYWIFGEAKASALPSAPGELFLNFGFFGLGLGALLLGVAARSLLRWITGFRGSVEFAWITLIWITANLLSNESFLVATWVKNWFPVMVLTILLVGRTSGPSYLRRMLRLTGTGLSQVRLRPRSRQPGGD